MPNLQRWEFYPMWAVYAPVIPYILWLATKARHPFFFSAVNPNMEAGGLFGASKFRQLAFLPNELKPITVLIAEKTHFNAVEQQRVGASINFPLIAKPDRAERGKGVALLHTNEELKTYHAAADYDFVIQSYIDFPLETAVFVYKRPNATVFEIPSLTFKEFLFVQGDGKKTLKELIFENFRAKRVVERLQQRFADEWGKVLPEGEIKQLEPIGNHNRGTKFMNANASINPELAAVFTEIAAYLPDFHYGRFDVRCSSLDDFLQGKNIKILEVNGVNAEPVHIYDTDCTPLEGWRTLIWHWSLIFDIAQNNRKNNIQPISFAEAWRVWQLRG